MAKKIYVVMGESGEYDDHTDWLVHAYVDEADADKHAKDANEWHAYWMDRVKGLSWRDVPKEYNPFDPSYTDGDHAGKCEHARWFVADVVYGRR